MEMMMHDRTDETDASEPAGDDALFDVLGELPPRKVPPGLELSFRRRLARERMRHVVRHPALIIGIAAALILVVGAGWLHERQLRLDEAHQMENQLATALQSLSTGARLQAIDATVRDGQHGDAVEQALIAALLGDPNTNVRMAAAEALGRIARPAALRQAVGRALAAEKSPFVQMTLLNTAGQLPMADRRAAISPLLARGDIDPMVTSDARERVREVPKGDSR
jgi:hypothetical protein